MNLLMLSTVMLKKKSVKFVDLDPVVLAMLKDKDILASKIFWWT